MLKNIFKRSGKLMMTVAMASAVTLPLMGAEAEAARGNTQSVFRNALSSAELSYTTIDGDLRIELDDITVIINIDASNDVVRVWGWIPTSLPRNRWSSGYATCNELNNQYDAKFWLDSDGDIRCMWAFDTDDIAVSPTVAKTAVYRVISGLVEAKKVISR